MTSSMVHVLADKVVGAGAAADQRTGKVARRVEAAADQFQRVASPCPSALGGIHGLGDAETERPEVPAECDHALPVDGGIEPGSQSASGSATTCAAA